MEVTNTYIPFGPKRRVLHLGSGILNSLPFFSETVRA